jgi:hypothetical protein
MTIEVMGRAPNVPKVKCMACKKVMEMDIGPFQQQGIDKPIKSKCPFCGAELFAALLILVDTRLDHLYKAIMAVVSITDKENQTLMGE